MKILWFTNIPMPAMLKTSPEKHAGTGGWMVSLLETLKAKTDIKLAVACIYPSLVDDAFEVDNIQYFCMSQPGHKRLFHFRLLDERGEFVKKCLRVIKEWGPDIIHIHGTERPYGLVAKIPSIEIPIVISIQGLVSEYSRWHNMFGNLRLLDIIRMHDHLKIIRGIGPVFDFMRLRKKALVEKEVLREIKFVFGRTEWDKAHVYAQNVRLRYYHVDELLRAEFNNTCWELENVQKYSILFTNARGPRQNVHVLYEALAILKRKFPKVHLQLAGQYPDSGYGCFLRSFAKRFGVENNVSFLGFLNAQDLATNLSKTHVFVIPSLIENSPNSLCEAQMVGVPCVASYTGGIPSIVQDGVSGLLFYPYDSTMLAYKIAEIFESDNLAVKLSKGAREVARIRHDQERVVTSILHAYANIIESS